jgi:hypothetical protein
MLFWAQVVIPVLSPGAWAASNYKTLHKFTGGGLEESFAGLVAYSDDVDGRFQRDVNGHSGHVNKVGAQRRWDYNHARHLRD